MLEPPDDGLTTAKLQEQSTMAKAIIYADSAFPLDPNLFATEALPSQSRARVNLPYRVSAAG